MMQFVLLTLFASFGLGNMCPFDIFNYDTFGMVEIQLQNIIRHTPSLFPEVAIPVHNFEVRSNGDFIRDTNVKLTQGALTGLYNATGRDGRCIKSTQLKGTTLTSCRLDLIGLQVTYNAQLGGGECNSPPRCSVRVRVRVERAEALVSFSCNKGIDNEVTSFGVTPLSLRTSYDGNLDVNCEKRRQFIEGVERYTRLELVRILHVSYLASLEEAVSRTYFPCARLWGDY